MNKEIKVTITISVDKTELDEAIKEMERLHKLQGKVNSNPNFETTKWIKKKSLQLRDSIKRWWECVFK